MGGEMTAEVPLGGPRQARQCDAYRCWASSTNTVDSDRGDRAQQPMADRMLPDMGRRSNPGTAMAR